MSRAHQPGGFDIVHLPVAGEFAAHHAGIAGHKGDAQREDHVILSEAEQRDEHQCEQDAREGGDRVVDAHERLVDHAAEIAGEGTDEDSHARAEQNRAEGDEKRRADAAHDAAEDVAAEVIGPEQVAKRRRGKLRAAGDGRWLIGRPERADDGQKRDERRHDEAHTQIVVLFLMQQHTFPSPYDRRSRGSSRWLMRSAMRFTSTTQNARITTTAWTTG